VQLQVRRGEHPGRVPVRGEEDASAQGVVPGDASLQPGPQRPVAGEDDGPRAVRGELVDGVEEHVLALAPAHRGGGDGEQAVGDAEPGAHPGDRLGGHRARVGDAVR
jgi:hypothetical protein